MRPKHPRGNAREQVAETIRHDIEMFERLNPAGADKPRARLEKVEKGEPVIAFGHELNLANDHRAYRLEPDNTLVSMTTIVWKPEGSQVPYVLTYEPGDEDRVELDEEEARRRYPDRVEEHLSWREAYRRARDASPDGLVRAGDVERVMEDHNGNDA